MKNSDYQIFFFFFRKSRCQKGMFKHKKESSLIHFEENYFETKKFKFIRVVPDGSPPIDFIHHLFFDND